MEQTKSFEYTRKFVESVSEEAAAEVARLGGNDGLKALLKMLILPQL